MDHHDVVFWTSLCAVKNGQAVKLIRRLESHLTSKKKRPLERGLGHGSDTVFQYYNSNDFRYLVEGDPGIECAFFASTTRVCRRMDPIGSGFTNRSPRASSGVFWFSHILLTSGSYLTWCDPEAPVPHQRGVLLKS